MTLAAAAPRPARVTMNALERRAALSLAAIAGLRMFGMFVILPVFALFAEALPGGRDRTLVGIALGAYGLTQALLQIPFGWASDRLGRKRVIYAGLALFALGSFVAALAPDIYWTIAGRALQGAGAVSAAVIALCADLTRETVRTRAMATIGIAIGATFALSLVVGPLLGAAIGVPGIFAATALLALCAIGVVRFAVPAPPAPAGGTMPPGALLRALVDPQLLRLNYGTFALHALLMSLFVEMPFALRDLGLPASRHWEVYLPVLLLSAVLMWPFLRQIDRRERTKPVFVGAIAVLTAAQVALALSLHSLAASVAGLLAFFAAFNVLESALPSLIARHAPPDLKGTAVGVFSSSQFLGTFVGGAVGGALAQHVSASAVFVFGIALSATWLLVSATMPAAPSSNYSMGET
jgi:MFS family permease